MNKAAGNPIFNYFCAQFGNPKGIVGRLAGHIMASRPSNIERNLWTLDLLNIGEGDRLLEIGFGPGFAIAQALTKAARLRIVGIDRSAVMLRMAAKRNEAAIHQGRVELRLGSVEDPPLKSGETFNKIYAVNTYPFWIDPKRCLARLYGLLTDGGKIAITFQPRHSGATDEEAIERGDEIVADLACFGRFQGNQAECEEDETRCGRLRRGDEMSVFN